MPLITPGECHTTALEGGSASATRHLPLDRHAMDPEAGVNGETPMKFLLLRTEVACRVGHRDDLRLIDAIRSPMSHDRRLPAGENVPHPIGTFAIGDGDQKGVVILDCYDARSSSMRCAEVRVRSSTGSGSNAGRSRGHQASVHARWKCLHVPRRTNSGRSRSRAGKGSPHQRGGTSDRQRGMSPRFYTGLIGLQAAAIAAQNRTRSSRHATLGRPGEGICPR